MQKSDQKCFLEGLIRNESYFQTVTISVPFSENNLKGPRSSRMNLLSCFSGSGSGASTKLSKHVFKPLIMVLTVVDPQLIHQLSTQTLSMASIVVKFDKPFKKFLPIALILLREKFISFFFRVFFLFCFVNNFFETEIIHSIIYLFFCFFAVSFAKVFILFFPLLQPTFLTSASTTFFFNFLHCNRLVWKTL